MATKITVRHSAHVAQYLMLMARCSAEVASTYAKNSPRARMFNAKAVDFTKRAIIESNAQDVVKG